MIYFLNDLANITTFIGGLFAIQSTLLLYTRDLNIAFAFICLAVVFDYADGYIARSSLGRPYKYQEFGAHMDCFVDMIAKGVFPATYVILYCNEYRSYLVLFSLVSLIYLASAVRYSHEFVVIKDEDITYDGNKNYGLTPDYAIFLMASLNLLFDTYTYNKYIMPVIVLVMYLLAIAPYEFKALTGKNKLAFVSFMYVLSMYYIL